MSTLATADREKCGDSQLRENPTDVSAFLTRTWRSLTPQERSRIERESEHAETLYLATKGSSHTNLHSTRPRSGPDLDTHDHKYQRYKEKYLSFTTQISVFWLKRWKELQAALKKNINVFGSILLGGPDIFPPEPPASVGLPADGGSIDVGVQDWDPSISSGTAQPPEPSRDTQRKNHGLGNFFRKVVGKLGAHDPGISVRHIAEVFWYPICTSIGTN